MVGFSSETQSWVSNTNSIYESKKHLDLINIDNNQDNKISTEKKKKRNKKNKKQVLLERYVEAADEEDDLTRTKGLTDDDLSRTKSLTDDDLDELKGCLDLGFGFSYEEIPELCNTLPALELCYSMSQKYLDDHKSPADTSPDTTTEPVASWKISSPGDHPEDVKARLKFWAQAVACTVKLCN